MPAGYRDRTPNLGPWIDARLSPPTENLDAGLIFADGRTGNAAWVASSGLWWGWCDIRKKTCALEPIGWRSLSTYGSPSHSR